jgi:hypothetical protein
MWCGGIINGNENGAAVTFSCEAADWWSRKYTDAMGKTLLAMAFLVALTGPASVSQDRDKGPSPGRGGTAPGWKRIVKLSDRRTFITDGALSLDVALAKPAALPSDVLGAAAAKLVERYLGAPLPDEFGLTQLRAGSGRTYLAPSGVVLNADYVDYLRPMLPVPRVRLRMKGDLEPVVILQDGKAVGLVMPMRGVGPPTPQLKRQS